MQDTCDDVYDVHDAHGICAQCMIYMYDGAFIIGCLLLDTTQYPICK